MSAKDIPTTRRKQVKQRERERCARCPGLGSQWHHRRPRSVVGEHRHCSCNGLWLCHTCHVWAHQHPEQARALGFIVSRTTEYPGDEPVELFIGLKFLTCDGAYRTPLITPPPGDAP